MSKRKPRNFDSVPKRIIKKLLAVLLIIGIPVLLLAITFHVKNVKVVGTNRYTSEEIKDKIIKTKLDTNALYLYLKYKYFNKITIPFIEKVDVELADNHTVKIYVYDKMVTGCVDFLGEYLYFDKDGIIVESSPKRLKDIPLIKGLKYNKIILNEKLEVQKEELFDVILNLTRQIDKYGLDVDSISFSNDYEVTLQCGDIKVLLGKKSTYDEALAELKNMLAEAKGMKIEIDMRNFVKGTNVIYAKPED
jgi:cell division protein FtsQ